MNELKQKIIDLGPWHLDVQVTPELSTAVSLEKFDQKDAQFSSAHRKEFVTWMKRVYHDGYIEGKRFLDCACNCGGYSFWAKELGASSCFGFDVRDHWIQQAEFLRENRYLPSDDISFQKLDLYDLPSLNLEPFEITIFKGIFYHLPDPITGLKIAADLTSELIIFDTATRYGQPDGYLAIASEDPDRLMSGVYGLNWFPTGRNVIMNIFRWMGFREFRILYERELAGERLAAAPRTGRLGMLAARHTGFFDYYDNRPI